jgi:hypothetical protein
MTAILLDSLVLVFAFVSSAAPFAANAHSDACATNLLAPARFAHFRAPLGVCHGVTLTHNGD